MVRSCPGAADVDADVDAEVEVVVDVDVDDVESRWLTSLSCCC